MNTLKFSFAVLFLFTIAVPVLAQTMPDGSTTPINAVANVATEAVSNTELDAESAEALENLDMYNDELMNEDLLNDELINDEGYGADDAEYYGADGEEKLDAGTPAFNAESPVVNAVVPAVNAAP